MKIAIAFLLGAALSALVLWLALPGAGFESDEPAAELDDDDHDYPSRVVVVDGQTRVLLRPREAELAGIVAAAPVRGRYAAFVHHRGLILDGRRLSNELRHYDAQMRIYAAEQKAVTTVREQHERMQTVAAKRSMGTSAALTALERELQRAQTALARANAARLKSRNELEAHWGPQLLDAVNAAPNLRAMLSTGQASLVHVHLEEDDESAALSVGSGDSPNDASVAERLSFAQVGDGTPRPHPAYVVRVDGLRGNPGMAVNVWSAAGGQTPFRYLVPESALVWHGGEQWYFERISKRDFTRRPLPPGISVEGGYAVDQPPEHEIVVTGAQSLLAEEFRGAIPIEDDD